MDSAVSWRSAISIPSIRKRWIASRGAAKSGHDSIGNEAHMHEMILDGLRRSRATRTPVSPTFNSLRTLTRRTPWTRRKGSTFRRGSKPEVRPYWSQLSIRPFRSGLQTRFVDSSIQTTHRLTSEKGQRSHRPRSSWTPGGPLNSLHRNDELFVSVESLLGSDVDHFSTRNFLWVSPESGWYKRCMSSEVFRASLSEEAPPEGCRRRWQRCGGMRKGIGRGTRAGG